METTATLLIKRDFNNDTQHAERLWLHQLDIDDGLIRPKLSYALNDTVNLWTGLDLFYGDNDGIFGPFDGRDRVVVGFEIGL